MLNIKDKKLRRKLWLAGILEIDEENLNHKAVNLVEHTNNLIEKIEALCDYLGVKLTRRNHHDRYTNSWMVIEEQPETLSSQNGMTKQTTTKQHNAYRKRRK
jgi:hypothetical protein